MLGTRGCRLGIIKPGLYRMQAKAILEAAIARKQAGGDPHVEIMIPLIVTEPELALLDRVGARGGGRGVRRRGIATSSTSSGTMVETPRAALVADEIAEVAEFFSFGTNDLTQMTFGFSRDDVEGRFMSEYLELKLLPRQPVRDARPGRRRPARAHRRRARPGDPARPQARDLRRARRRPGVGAFCDEVGLDYVSCSPYRVPIARLAAAHAALGAGGPATTA